MTSKNARTPAGLGVTGRSLFRRVSSAYELRPDEFAVLEAAARTSDLVEQLAAALVGAPLLTAGVGGQDRVNPLLVELRQQRICLAGLLRQLRLPDDGVKVNQQRTAGNASWASRSSVSWKA
jgi:hypothetical protein